MRGKLTRPAKDILSNWMKVTGSDLGKYIKEAHNGSGSSHSRVAYVNDFITDASASGSIGSTSAGTPAGTLSSSSALDLATPAFSGTGYATAGQVVTTTGNHTMTLNECAGMWFIADGLPASPAVLILSNTAVTGAPAVLTCNGVPPVTDAGTYKIVKNVAQVFAGAALGGHVHTITGDAISDINLAVETAGAGTPIAQVTADDHSVTLKLAVNNEAESARMDFANQLVFNSEKKPYFETLATFTRDGAAASYAIIGLATDHNSNPDLITKSAWFKIIDSGTAISCVIESDDGVTDTDDKAIEYTIASGTQYRFAIDFSDLNNISFYINDAFVGKTSAAALTGNLQPYFIVAKASGASQAELKSDLFRVESNR